ncbi:hypothetical protein VTK73DRAFT_7862 [Phialemonium thermophilum]|uniref:Uncharacterized protein n=1 Tax=Phialemonium thermophilum TaxID=223376 RepID=A0ABR3WC25_9PEZI
MTPDEVESLLRSGLPGRVGQDGDEDEEPMSPEERARRTQELDPVLRAARDAWLSGSPVVDQIAEKLGDGSRNPCWRLPIGDSGILEFFLNILTLDGLRQPLRIHALRLVGNSCADTDENRAIVVQSNYLPSLINLLADDSLLSYAIPVLYNICVDYEPAQLQASSLGLSSRLISLINGPRSTACRPLLGFICKILSLLVSQDFELKQAAVTIPLILLRLATSKTPPPDIDDFCSLNSVALAYLANERFQAYAVQSRSFELLINAFSESCSRFDTANADPENVAELKQIWNAFVLIIADTSALPSFPVLYPVGSPVVQRLVHWLSGPSSYAHLQTASCLALGNLARSDDTSVAIAKDVFAPLLHILTRAVQPLSSTSLTQSHPTPPSTVPAQLLHAVLSFLKNLAIPAANKRLLGALLDPPTSILPRLWSSTDTQPQTQFAAVSLTRLLLTPGSSANAAGGGGAIINVRRLCAPLSADPASPAHERSNLQFLTDLHARVDAEPTKLEAARAVAAVCRALHSNPVSEILGAGWDGPPSTSAEEGSSSYDARHGGLGSTNDAVHGIDNRAASGHGGMDVYSSRRAHFYAAHLGIADALMHLVTQSRFPALRSEGWFVLAILSLAPDGAHLAVRVLDAHEPYRALVLAVTGRDMIDDLLPEDRTHLDQSTAQGKRDDATEEPGLDGLGDPLAARSGDNGPDIEGMILRQRAQQRQQLGIESDVLPSTILGGSADGLELEPRQIDPAQGASMAAADRSNALVLVAQVLRHCSQCINWVKRSLLEHLLATAGQSGLSDQSSQAAQ